MVVTDTIVCGYSLRRNALAFTNAHTHRVSVHVCLFMVCEHLYLAGYAHIKKKLLHVLVQFMLSRYNRTVNYHAGPKLIVFLTIKGKAKR